MLLMITAALGILIILYSLLKQFIGFELDEAMEKYFFDIVFIAALGLFIYNRKMASDERKAKEAAEEEERRQAEASEEEDADEAVEAVIEETSSIDDSIED